jgi:hypothetical protein
MDAVELRFKEILTRNTTTSGYRYLTDLGKNIYPWRTRDLQESELPGAFLRDVTNDQEHFTMQEYTNRLTVEMEIKCAPGSATIDDIYRLISDVNEAIAEDDQWTVANVPLAHDTQPRGDKTAIEQEGRIIAGVTIYFEIEYQATKWSF